MSKHPGKTAAQRRAIDEIACGNRSPIMSPATCDALLKAGLIEELESKRIPGIGSLCIKVRQFEMPIWAHYKWCKFQSEQPQ